MSQEELSVDVTSTISELTSQDIAAAILPVLNADEAVHAVDLDIIKKRALVLATEDPSLTVEDAILNAAADRLSARVGTETPVTVMDSTGFVHAVVGKGVSATAEARKAAEAYRENGDASSDR